MRLRIVSILIVTVLAGSFSGLYSARAAAQSQPVVNTLKVSLWPEYDRPSMLVIYRAMLSSDSALPVNMIFRIPLAAQPFVVAVGANSDSVSEVNYSQNVTGEWREIGFPATLPAIQFEYYDNSLLIDNQARHFEYVWPGDYKVQAMTLEIQKPLGASDVKIVPNIGVARLGDDDVEYYSTEVGALPAGQSYKVTLDYNKTTSKLTAEQMPVKAGQSVPADLPEKERLRNILIGSAVILGIALIMEEAGGTGVLAGRKSDQSTGGVPAALASRWWRRHPAVRSTATSVENGLLRVTVSADRVEPASESNRSNLAFVPNFSYFYLRHLRLY